jgi:hypothetical protein
MEFWATLIGIGIPGAIVTAIVGFMVRKIERRMDEERNLRLEQDKARKQFEKFQARGLSATMALCEANAIALQNGKCNGETHRALDYMQRVKYDQRDFLTSQGIDHIF